MDASLRRCSRGYPQVQQRVATPSEVTAARLLTSLRELAALAEQAGLDQEAASARKLQETICKLLRVRAETLLTWRWSGRAFRTRQLV